MKRLTVAGMMLGVLLMMAVCAFGAAVPQVINYSGTLTNKVGAAVPDGTYNIEFNIYNVPSAGTSLWTEKWSATAIPPSPVLVTGGVFNVMLGTITPFPDNFFADNPNTYLGIKVGADSEMLPRQKIASVGYAFAAGNGVPKDGIIMWKGAVDQVPAGWALCNGQNGTPDLQDKFVVGVGVRFGKDKTRGVSGGEEDHVLKESEMPSHNHTQNPHNHTQNPHRHNQAQAKVGSGTATTVADNDTANEWETASSTANNNPETATNNPIGGGQPHNTLPPYYALAFIMKL